MKRLLIAPAVLVLVLAGCATGRHLEFVDLQESNLRVEVRGETTATVDADYHLQVDADDPIGTMISVGTSVAKASQVREAQRRLERATRGLDLRAIVEAELSEFFGEEFGARIVERTGRADYLLVVEIDEYGIESGSWGGAIEMQVVALVKLYDARDGERVWRRRVSATQEASPSLFGISGAAGNVLSAALLNELSEEEIARGMDRLSREIAWEIAYEFEDDYYRARF